MVPEPQETFGNDYICMYIITGLVPVEPLVYITMAGSDGLGLTAIREDVLPK